MKISLLLIIFFLFNVGIAVACAPKDVIPSPSIEPSIEPTMEVTVVPSEAPVSVEPSITAGASATATHGDGLSDHRSDGLSSCPSCTAAPSVPSAPPATGRG